MGFTGVINGTCVFFLNRAEVWLSALGMGNFPDFSVGVLPK